MDSVKSSLAEALQVSDCINKERPLGRGEFVTEQQNDPIARSMPIM